MLDRPDKTEVLWAVAAFLQDELAGALDDRRLKFRVRIAAHLLGTLALEVRGEDVREAAELRGLRALLGVTRGDPPGTGEERRALIGALRHELARRLQGDRLGEAELEAARGQLMETLRAELAITSPRFDVSPDIESP